MQASLRFGIQPTAQAPVAVGDLNATVGDQIERLLAEATDSRLQGRIREALKSPQSVLEVRCGQQVQTVTAGMPLRELVSTRTEAVEIVVNQPQAGG
ncbi:MAG: hypothetical protein WDA75_16765 [Candidatus Latescibacterota bacterium]|jgi:hypothetical protein